MKLNIYKLFKPSVVVAGLMSFLVSCNKQLPVAVPLTPQPVAGTGGTSTLLDLLNDPNFSILKAAVIKAGTAAPTANSPISLPTLLADKTAVFTFFAPTDAAFQASGIPSVAALAAFRPGQLDTLLRYNLIGGQALTSTNISSSFPNLQSPSTLVLQGASPSLPPGLRMSIFPSKRGSTLFVNNIPVTQNDIAASNGVLQTVAFVVAPPSQFLWDRISSDPGLTYFKAAIQRADSGSTAATSLVAALQNPAANLTVFAPTDLAFQQILTAQITAALIAQGVPPTTAAAQASALASSPTVFQNPALFSVLTAQTVKGIVVYHILGTRVFSVNFPTTPTATPTLLNGAIPTHPGVLLQATFGTTGVTAATVKGVANASASNILINPTPAPGGTSDQHYINGVLFKIDQVLRPQ